jgi:hypothetical protein
MRQAREALASVLDTCTLQALHDRAHPLDEEEIPA